MSNERPKRFFHLPLRVPRLVFDATEMVIVDRKREGYVTNRTEVLREVLVRWALGAKARRAKECQDAMRAEVARTKSGAT